MLSSRALLTLNCNRSLSMDYGFAADSEWMRRYRYPPFTRSVWRKQFFRPV